jgi:K(+)-stimulated pyrophosphate-energized sodium pump
LPARVHFSFGSTVLDERASRTIAAIVAGLKGTSDTVVVTGYADSRGTPQGNHRFAAERAKAVRDALVGQGIAGERIRLVEPAQVIGDGSAAEARRVEIASSSLSK